MKDTHNKILLFLFILFVTGCTSPKKTVEFIDVCTACGYGLTEKEYEKYFAEAKSGNVDAAFRLYQYFEFSKSDPAKSLFWLKKAADGGKQVAQFNYAVYLMNFGDETDHKAAFNYLNNLASANEPHAKFEIIQLYLKGIGTEKNLKKACGLLNEFEVKGDEYSKILAEEQGCHKIEF